MSTLVPGKATHNGDDEYGRVVDASWVGDLDGWVLVSTRCADGSGEPCARLLHTTDGGKRWVAGNAPNSPVPGQLGCTSRCIGHLDFGNGRTGYLWGMSTLFVTTDAGAHWSRGSGGADALAISGDTAIRLVSDHSGCPGPCNLRVQTAPIGGSRWTAARLPGRRIDTGGVTLQALPDGRAFLETSQGQAGSLYSVRYFVSSDEGRSWTEHPDPCRSVGATAAGVPMASSQMSAGTMDGSLSILCTSGGDTKAVVITSIDGGRRFSAARVFDSTQAGQPLGPIGALSSRVLVTAWGPKGSGLSRSTDGGRTWRPVAAVTGSGTVNAPVFVNASTGYLIAPGGRTLWLTHDAGATWTPEPFG